MLFFIEPQLFEDFKLEAVAFMENHRSSFVEEFGEDGFNQRLQDITQTTQVEVIAGSLIKKLFAGFFVSPVVTVILRKKPIE